MGAYIMENNNKYMIWCNQTHHYFADNSEFESLTDIKEQLISYHEVDVEEDLSDWMLSDYLEAFGWEVHDLEGNVILIEGNNDK